MYDEAHTLLDYLIEHGDIELRAGGQRVFVAPVDGEVLDRLMLFEADLEGDTADLEPSEERDVI